MFRSDLNREIEGLRWPQVSVSLSPFNVERVRESGISVRPHNKALCDDIIIIFGIYRGQTHQQLMLMMTAEDKRVHHLHSKKEAKIKLVYILNDGRKREVFSIAAFIIIIIIYTAIIINVNENNYGND